MSLLIKRHHYSRVTAAEGVLVYCRYAASLFSFTFEALPAIGALFALLE